VSELLTQSQPGPGVHPRLLDPPERAQDLAPEEQAARLAFALAPPGQPSCSSST
jgi:hypothetical protein